MAKFRVIIESPRTETGMTYYEEHINNEDLEGRDLDDYAEEIFTNMCSYKWEIVDD